MIGIFYILLFYLLGVVMSYFIADFIPGSIIGMILFFAALSLKIVKAEKVKTASLFLLNNMALFFVPIGVGLITSYTLISGHWFSILVSVLVSTVLVIASVGAVMQWAERRNK